MNQSYFDTARVWTSVAWAVVTALVLAGWIAMMAGAPEEWAYMLALTSGVAAPFAATLHVKTYLMHIDSQVRANGAALRRQQQDAEVHPFR